MVYIVTERKEKRVEKGLLLILMGGVFPHAFMTPPRKMGMYVISHFAKIGEF